MRFYVDDGILIEVRFFQDGRRLQRTTESLASDYFRLLGPHGPRDPQRLKAHKILGWSTSSEVLGWVFDTIKLTILLQSRKSFKLRQVFAEWPHSRHSATCKQIAEMTGFLLHVSVAVHPDKFVVQAHANMSLFSAAGILSSRGRSRRLVPLGPEFYGELEFWRWIVEVGIDASEGGLSAAMYCLVALPPCRTLISGAFKHAVGGFCLKTG